MFKAPSTTALCRSAMSSAERLTVNFQYILEQKSAVDRLHGTPTERDLVSARSYRHRTPTEWRNDLQEPLKHIGQDA